MSSRFGLYAFGWFLFLASYLVSDAVMAANKLGGLSAPVPINGWTTFGVIGGLLLFEWLAALLEVAGRE